MKKVSRRAFARDAIAAVAVAAVAPSAMAQQAPPATPSQPKPPAETPELSARSRAEAEARVNAILARHGHRLSDAQKADVRRLAIGAQPAIDAFRAYPLPNGAEPATVFRVRLAPPRPRRVESHTRSPKS